MQDPGTKVRLLAGIPMQQTSSTVGCSSNCLSRHLLGPGDPLGVPLRGLTPVMVHSKSDHQAGQITVIGLSLAADLEIVCSKLVVLPLLPSHHSIVLDQYNALALRCNSIISL